MAMAGGVNALLAARLVRRLLPDGHASPEGRCRAFDARRQRLRAQRRGRRGRPQAAAAALADGDRIYAVIRGTAMNQDGRTHGMTMPSQQAQEGCCARRAATRASPAGIDYVEAHGTGTLVGDPIEAEPWAVRCRGSPPGIPSIGSVKTNIGHLEAAAGIAGLIKTALVPQPREIPPNLHFQVPNPAIPFDDLRAPRRDEPGATAITHGARAGGDEFLRVRGRQRHGGTAPVAAGERRASGAHGTAGRGKNPAQRS